MANHKWHDAQLQNIHDFVVDDADKKQRIYLWLVEFAPHLDSYSSGWVKAKDNFANSNLSSAQLQTYLEVLDSVMQGADAAEEAFDNVNTMTRREHNEMQRKQFWEEQERQNDWWAWWRKREQEENEERAAHPHIEQRDDNEMLLSAFSMHAEAEARRENTESE